MAAHPAMPELAVGAFRIAALVERSGPWRRPEELLACTAEEAAAELIGLDPLFFDAESGRLVIAHQSFLLRTPRHVILVDTCSGDHKGLPPPLDYPKQPWLDRFADLGLDPAGIDYVVCTHMHFDHTGWNTRLEDGRWVPTFPNARYIFHRGEYEYWQAEAAKAGDPQSGIDAVWRMNCRPIVEAGQALLVDDGFEIEDGVRLVPAPGHTPHHCCIEVKSQGTRALFVGDLLHHELQMRRPEWSTRFCWDPGQAASSRERILDQLAAGGGWMIPSHFPPPTAGLVQKRGDAFRFVPGRR